MPQAPSTHTASLRAVEEQLKADPDDFEERITERERQRERQRKLRASAKRLRRQAHTASELVRKLDHLKGVRENILSRQVSVGHVGGGNGPGGGGMEPRYVFAMNQAIDEAWGRAELEERIQKLEAELEDLLGGRSAS